MGYLFFATRARSTVGAHQAAQAVAFGISLFVSLLSSETNNLNIELQSNAQNTQLY